MSAKNLTLVIVFTLFITTSLIPASMALDGRDVWKENSFIKYRYYDSSDYNEQYYTQSDKTIEGTYRLKYVGMNDGYMTFTKSTSDPELMEIIDEENIYVDPNTGKEKGSDDWAGVFTDLSSYGEGDTFSEIEPIEIDLPNADTKFLVFKFEEQTEFTMTLDGKDVDVPVWRIGLDSEVSYSSENYQYKAKFELYIYLSITNGVRLKGYGKITNSVLDGGVYETLSVFTVMVNAIEGENVVIMSGNGGSPELNLDFPIFSLLFTALALVPIAFRARNKSPP